MGTDLNSSFSKHSKLLDENMLGCEIFEVRSEILMINRESNNSDLQ
jgi:hypothetical protein